MVGKPPPSANADIAEVEHKSETAPRVRARTGEEPEELERKMRVSRNVEEHELENALRSAVKPKMLKVPGEPSENERRLHELTHLPYRDWCEHCVKSKGRQSHAVKKKNDRQPVIQIDFSFMATENDLPKRTILNATDVQTGYSMAVVLPSKGSVAKYAVAELRKFVFEIGRTFGIVQYDKEAPLKTMARDLFKVVGGMSMRSAPTGHSQSQGSVGNAQRTHMIGADGKTAYSRRWNREYNGSLCMFGELIDAKDTEADEVVLGNANGVFKEVLLKETGQLVPGSKHTFLGRRLRCNGDSIDVCMSQKYIDATLELYGMKDAEPVATTGTVTINKTVPDTPLSPEKHKVYRTAVGKLLWLALVRGDIAYATKELRQSVAKCKHLLRYLIGTRISPGFAATGTGRDNDPPIGPASGECYWACGD
eukprot:s2319_g15.t1